MKSFSYEIKEEAGLHARPAGMLVKCAAGFASNVTICCGEKEASAKKLFAVMGMQVKKGSVVTFRIEGEDENAACETLERFVEENL